MEEQIKAVQDAENENELLEIKLNKEEMDLILLIKKIKDPEMRESIMSIVRFCALKSTNG